MKDELGKRMKENYEDRYRIKLTRRMPVIIRLDGKSFHTFTKQCHKPFDELYNRIMYRITEYLITNIQGAKVAYTQSDEISLLLTDFDKLTTDAWFDYNVQKMTSVSSGMASGFLCLECEKWFRKLIYPEVFDSRVFNIPREEVTNYFIWRQKDWIRNSVQMLAQSVFSHKELNGKNQSSMHDMLYTKGINWADLNDKWKNGIFIFKEDTSYKKRTDIILTDNREMIERYLKDA